MHAEARRAMALVAVAHSEVLATTGQMTGALACSVASVSHLSFRKKRV
jgi:hypothetical protein